MPCVLTRDLREHAVIDAARGAGINLMGLTDLHATPIAKPSFLMGYAAYTPAELEVGVLRLAKALRSIL